MVTPTLGQTLLSCCVFCVYGHIYLRHRIAPNRHMCVLRLVVLVLYFESNMVNEPHGGGATALISLSILASYQLRKVWCTILCICTR